MLKGTKRIWDLKKKRGKNIVVKLFSSPEEKENHLKFTITVFKSAFSAHTEF